jgi:hypothetical protein
MSRPILLTVFLLTALGLFDRSLSACGDKFLVLGRSVGYQSLLKASKPGSLVLYRTPSLPKVFSNGGGFDLVMDVAGHRLSTVSDPSALGRALASGKIDLVLADPATSRQIGAVVNTSSTALVVPILVDGAAGQRTVLEKEFGCVMPLAEPRKVIDALDKAMKLRAKRAAAHSA